jgi:hypothetical protein
MMRRSWAQEEPKLKDMPQANISIILTSRLMEIPSKIDVREEAKGLWPPYNPPPSYKPYRVLNTEG